MASRTMNSLWWPVLAAALVIALGLTSARRGSVVSDVAATVDGVPVMRARVAEIAAETQGQSADARDAMTRAIDEALWLRQAWKLGLPQQQAEIREALIANVQARVLAKRPIAEPTQAQLRALYARAPERFRQSSGVRVQRWTFSPARGGMRSAWARATQAYTQLAAASGAVPPTLTQLADPERTPLPRAVLSLPQLRKAIGVEASILVSQLGEGETSRPVEHGGAIHIYRMLARDASITPPFELIGPRIADEYLYQERERLLIEELQRLRTHAQVQRM